MADNKGSGAPPSYPAEAQFSQPFAQQQQQQQQQHYTGEHIQNAPPPMQHHGSHYEGEKNFTPTQNQGHNAPNQQQQQQQMAAQGYQTAVSIPNLGAGAAPIDCPACNMRQMTKVQAKAGGTTWAWAAGACVCILLPCIPFCIRSTKDIEHYCGHCNTKVATWHRSGHTEVHLHR